jgi:biotin carboxyl carrier protein
VGTSGFRHYTVYIGDNVLTVGVEEVEEGAEPRQHIVAMPSPIKKAPAVAEVASEPESVGDETGEVAPMPRIIIRYEVKEGDKVKAGDNVLWS